MKKKDVKATIPTQVRPRATGVIYRATLPGGREGALHPSIAPADATMADAWRRWSGVCPGIDPNTLEIEIHHAATTGWPARGWQVPAP